MPRGRGGRSAGPVDRNAQERDRRIYTKELFSRLAFLLPSLAAKRSVNELLDQAIGHVRKMGQKVEMLKEKKKQPIEGTCNIGHDQTGRSTRDGGFPMGRDGSSSSSTVLTVSDFDSLLEVCMKGGANKTFSLHKVIQVVEEEAAQVVAVSYSYVGGVIFYTIKAQAVCPRIGIETSSVYERLKELIF